jgi:hypothetical protein
MPSPARHNVPRRRVTLADAMILIGVTALGLWGIRAYERPLPLYRNNPMMNTLKQMSPLLAAWTMAVPLLALRGPRPRLGRLARQPGVAACGAAALVIAAETAGAILRVRLSTAVFPLRIEAYAEVWFIQIAGFAVAAAWLTLALAGRWRASPHWIDRLGRLWGTFWIGASLAAGLGL